MKIAEYIIGNIDDDGYLRRELSAIGDDLIFQEGQDVEEKEVEDILVWLTQEKKEFIENFISTGGEFMIIIQLPGTLNSMSLLSKPIMKNSLHLGVLIGIEVFPNLKQPFTD